MITIDPLSALGLGLDVLKEIHKMVEDKITVEPKFFSCDANNCDLTKTFIISNKIDKPVFDIQALVWLNNGADAEISIENQETGHEESLGNVCISSDLFIIKGRANNKFLNLLQIAYLSQRTDKRLFIKFKKPGNYSLSIVKYSNEASLFGRTENKIFLPHFSVPFPMEMISVSALLRRKT